MALRYAIANLDFKQKQGTDHLPAWRNLFSEIAIEMSRTSTLALRLIGDPDDVVVLSRNLIRTVTLTLTLIVTLSVTLTVTLTVTLCLTLVLTMTLIRAINVESSPKSMFYPNPNHKSNSKSNSKPHCNFNCKSNCISNCAITVTVNLTVILTVNPNPR